MKKKIVYTDEPMGEPRVIPNFLPPPEMLAFREANVKVTMTLSLTSIEYFKRLARKSGTPYQTIIRRLVDSYAARHARR